VTGSTSAGRKPSRGAGLARPAAPVRLVHLGLGNFHRAHQAWYTEHAPDAEDWGYASFTGRRVKPAEALTAQDGLYTLITRAPDGDRFEVIGSLSRVHAGTDHGAWLHYLAAPEVGAVTITVTEAGYLRGPDGGLDRDRDDVQADVAALRVDPEAVVLTTPARLAAGCAARRRTDAGPLALVSCDNLLGNGALAARVVRDLAEMLDPGLAAWIEQSVSVVSTEVDRITPRPSPDDQRTLLQRTGVDDCCPVATEPFSEWVLSGAFPAGRPRWEDAGATLTDDVTPYEHRKLWLLNGGHSLLAYTGGLRGHQTVAEAVGDGICRGWLEQWWDEASGYLDQPADVVAGYRTRLLDRFANPRMHHRLEQIATDGSQKLPVRILPVLRQERAAGRMPQGAALVLAGWVGYLRGSALPVHDVRADEMTALAGGSLSDGVRNVLHALDPALAGDDELVQVVCTGAEQLLGEPASARARDREA
jgi:fructuronate reductase